MSTQPGDLRLLLRLMEGTLPPPDRATLRERFASDRELRQRWDYLNNLPPLTAEEALAVEHIAIDHVAAFIDDTLPADSAARFEKESWKSPALLTELVNLTQSHGVTAVTSQLTGRLAAMMPPPPKTVKATPIGTTTDAISTSTSSTIDIAAPSIDRPAVLPATEPRVRQTTRSKQRRANTIVVGLATVACVALLGWLVWFVADRRDRKQIVTPEPQPKSQPEPLGPQTPPQKLVEDKRAPNLDAPTPDKSPELKLPDHAPSPDRDAPKVVDVPNNPPPAPRRPEPDKQMPPTIKTIDWLEVKGLVAARLTVRDTWLGYGAKRKIPIDGHYVTFPGTRAVASGKNGIELVVDQQTEFSELSWADEIQLRVTHGRVAFRNLPDDTQVRFLIGDTTHNVTARRDGTTIWFDLRWGEPRIGVHRGIAVVNKQKLDKKTYYLATQQRRTSIQTDAQFNGWLGAWQASVPINSELLAELRTSNNIRARLGELTRDNTLSQAVSNQVTFTVAPHDYVHRLLLSRNTDDHAIAIRWLAQQPKTGLAWTNIGRTLLRQNMSINSQSQRQAENNARRQIQVLQRWLEEFRTTKRIDAKEISRVRAAMKPRLIQNFVAAFQTLQNSN